MLFLIKRLHPFSVVEPAGMWQKKRKIWSHASFRLLATVYNDQKKKLEIKQINV